MNHPLLVSLWAAAGLAVGAGMKWAISRSHPAPPSIGGSATTASTPDPAPSAEVSSRQPTAPSPPRPTLADLLAAPARARLGILIRWLPDATEEDVASLAHTWFADSQGNGTAEWHLLVLRWVDLDPAAAMTFGRGYTDRLLKSVGSWDTSGNPVSTPLHPVYRAWGKRDPEAALAALALEPRKYRKHLATGLDGMIDADRARAWALAHPEWHEFAGWRAQKPSVAQPDLSNPAQAADDMRPEAHASQAAKIAGEWMKSDPDAALAWARGLTDPKQRRHALQSVMNGFLTTDPARARPLIDELPAGLSRARVEARYTAALAKTDPEAAMRHATESLRGTAQLEAIAGIAAEKGKSDSLAALKMLRDHGIGDFGVGGINNTRVDGPSTSMGGSSGIGPVGEVLKAAAGLDPAGVMQLLVDTGTLRSGISDLFGRDNSLGYTLFSDWAARDTNAAAGWLAQQPNGPGIASLAGRTADRWPVEDIAGLQALATRFSPGDARDLVVAEAARRLVVTDPAGALVWATQTGGDSGFSATFQHVAETNPQTAVSLYTDTLTPPQQESQRQALTDQLARRSATDAIAFFESLPQEAQAGVKLHDTTRSYARENPQAASEWIATLPPTAAKDTAIGGLVDYLISDAAEPDPVAAAHWAGASLDPNGRDQRLQFVAEAWFRRDPQAAPAAIRASGLPPDIQTTLLQHAPRPR